MLVHPKIDSSKPSLENGLPMIEALRAVRYGVTDLALASQWYSQLLDMEPCLSSDTSVRYFVDGSWLELTLGSPAGQFTTVAYWGVNNMDAEILRLRDAGILPHSPNDLVNTTTQTVTFFDPFGNTIGLIEFDDPGVLRARSQRVAEKVALRNVREALDDLSVQDGQQRKANRFVLAILLVAVLLVVAGGTIAWLRIHLDRSATSKIAIPLGGIKPKAVQLEK